MNKGFTRRQVLKMIAASVTMAALSPVLHARARYPSIIPPFPEEKPDPDPGVLMGRAIHTVAFYEEPSASSTRLETRYRDESFQITDEVRAPYSRHNDLWYKTPLGYVHSAWVLPVRVYLPQPLIRDLGEWGFWGQVSQIYTFARAAPSVDAGAAYRLYGGTVYRVVESLEDEEGTGWYKIADDYPPKTERYHWVLARDLRRIPRREMAPIHPFASGKRVEVDLTAQSLTCFERDEIVFTTLVASGLGGDLATPRGEMCVLLKQPSRHMANVPYPGMAEEDQPDPSDIFDLPGVPWNIFFDLSGTAIHGAYWHNDYGIRRSHGCLNVAIEAARWIYRWINPIAGFEDDFVQSNCRVGTPITIY
ncbi:MAG: L,D-transpeptidase [Anaerolineae bacterium]